jgi:hypothetical protein
MADPTYHRKTAIRPKADPERELAESPLVDAIATIRMVSSEVSRFISILLKAELNMRTTLRPPHKVLARRNWADPREKTGR